MQESRTVMASIVLYEPDFIRLEKNIAAIKNQVDKVVLVLNSTCDEVKTQYQNKESIILIQNKENAGIAKALNQAMEYAYHAGYDWVITLDQDSIASGHLVEVLYRHIDGNVGIVAPSVVDMNTGEEDAGKTGIAYVDRCITSAALTSVKAWREVGGFTEELFIDYVDCDYCAKLVRAGYGIIKDYDAKFHHEIGHGRRLKIGKKYYDIYNHNEIRRYYYTRNVIYYYKTYSDLVNVKKEKRDLLIRCLMVLIFEKKKWLKFKRMLRGVKDAKILLGEMEHERENRKDNKRNKNI